MAFIVRRKWSILGVAPLVAIGLVLAMTRELRVRKLLAIHDRLRVGMPCEELILSYDPDGNLVSKQYHASFVLAVKAWVDRLRRSLHIWN